MLYFEIQQSSLISELSSTVPQISGDLWSHTSHLCCNLIRDQTPSCDQRRINQVHFPDICCEYSFLNTTMSYPQYIH
ncbi:unnamed protein product [Moneuplotes crassus]|uniref:Uncharacterized protein n=1 Tax=Euplotes crassus TaxID=5936 RepID=A0AAD1XTN3_EUPCR|nr:unnamed protein product [Moneuplotes crassus]